MKKWFLCIGLALFIGAFIGCKKESPTETDVLKLSIVGKIERWPSSSYPDSFRYSERVDVSNTEAVPSVKINEQELELHSGDGFCFRETFPLTPDTAYELVVTVDSDTATATVTLPGDFSITAPNTSYVLPIGSSLDISWDSASHSNYYRVYLSVHYIYYDYTSGLWQLFTFSSDTIISETSITYGSSLLFPNLYNVRPGCGYLNVDAINGPSLAPDTQGNVSGDGTGFFWAKQKRKCYFHVGRFKKTSKEDRARRRKEALKEQDKLWKQRIEKLKEGLEL